MASDAIPIKELLSEYYNMFKHDTSLADYPRIWESYVNKIKSQTWYQHVKRDVENNPSYRKIMRIGGLIDSKLFLYELTYLNVIYEPIYRGIDAGAAIFYFMGKFKHRLVFPAVYLDDGGREYWIQNVLHRNNGPAVYYPGKFTAYYSMGILESYVFSESSFATDKSMPSSDT